MKIALFKTAVICLFAAPTDAVKLEEEKKKGGSGPDVIMQQK